MYIELRSSRFRDPELQAAHGRIVDALETRDPRAVRDALLDDIVEAQQVILAFGTSARQNAPLHQDGVITSVASLRESTSKRMSSGDGPAGASNHARRRTKASA